MSAPGEATGSATAAAPADGEYPRFSHDEMTSRAARLDALLAEHDADHLLVYGANRFGSAVAWLTGWPVTREALVVHTPGERDLLLVNFYNHVPNARRIATEAEVEWAGESAIESALAELRRRGAGDGAVAAIGPFGHVAFAALKDFAVDAIDLSRAYARLRQVKSAEEIAWTRAAARMTDAGVRALRERAVAGATEYELAAAVEGAYLARGGTTHIHYFGATPMAQPGTCVPAQWPANRALRAGDALSCEVSASWWGYTGQLLRTFTIEAEPTPLYRELHDAADAAYDAIVAQLRPGASAADLVEAATVIEDAGFTTRDDLVHGFVGGYLPPIVGSASRTLTGVPEFTFAEGMMVVVQPNVVTPDERAGVQTGELVLVAEHGAESMHAFERGLLTTG